MRRIKKVSSYVPTQNCCVTQIIVIANYVDKELSPFDSGVVDSDQYQENTNDTSSFENNGMNLTRKLIFVLHNYIGTIFSCKNWHCDQY